MDEAPFSIGSEVWPGTSKVIEECGELTQVLGKLIGAGGETLHWDGTDLQLRLEEEIGDVLAAIRFFLQVNPVVRTQVVEDRASEKQVLFWKWHLGN